MDDFEILPQEICNFWIRAGRQKWFAKDEAFDTLISMRYLQLWQKALAGRLPDWYKSDDGLMALTLIFDQFPRNMFRNDPRAFCSDKEARKAATKALDSGLDQRVSYDLSPFLYLPFEHSELLTDQEYSLRLFKAYGDEEMLHFAQIHYDIIARFGRFPHRNKSLGRSTTQEEQEFLDAGGFKG